MDAAFRNRADAGARLAQKLARYGLLVTKPVVLGLPRGGVPVAYEVARALDAPLDVYVVRKLGVPAHPELAMGAIASGGARVVNEQVVRELGIGEDVLDAVAEEEGVELARREGLFRGGAPPASFAGRTVIVVDDGLATGSTMRAAVQALRAAGARWIAVAVPVGSPGTCAELRREADDVVCLATPEPFHAVGLWYDDFEQTTDDEVRELLARAAARPQAAGMHGAHAHR